MTPDHRTGDVPDFVTHYFRRDRQPLRNLSDLPDDEVERVLACLAADGASRRGFGSRYLALRRATEDRLRTAFVARGGRPQRSSPHYFVLGTSDWFAGLYDEPGEIRLALADLPDDVTSVTYPDSVTSIGPLADFGVPVYPQPYHGQVFRVGELAALVAEHGLPASPRPDSYDGHQRAPFEHYVEVQLWADGPVRRYLG